MDAAKQETMAGQNPSGGQVQIDKASTEAKGMEPEAVQEKAPANIFDKVFRSMIEYLPQLIPPLINEVFGTGYLEDTPFAIPKNEHIKRTGAIITDLLVEMGGNYYHVEVQSTLDGHIVIRMIEYAFAIGLERAEKSKDGSFRMKLPNSCVIFLRSNKNTPDKLTMYVEAPTGDELKFDVPVLKLQEYTKEKLLQKRLLILLPYYLMRYEKELKAIGAMAPEQQEEADRRFDIFIKEYVEVCKGLRRCCGEDEKGYFYQTLMELIAEIAEYLAPDNEKERMRAMRSDIIRTQAQIILEQGIEQGIEQSEAKWRMEEKKDTVFSLADMGMPPEKIAQAVKVGVDTVRQWLAGDMAVAK